MDLESLILIAAIIASAGAIGFVADRLSRPRSKKVTHLHSDGTFLTEVVGESFYRSEIRKIAKLRNQYSKDGVDFFTEASLVLDDNNVHDNFAVAIKIDGKKVGHLSRSDAKDFRKFLNNSGHKGSIFLCSARIVGGWERSAGDRGDFGISLDLEF